MSSRIASFLLLTALIPVQFVIAQSPFDPFTIPLDSLIVFVDTHSQSISSTENSRLAYKYAFIGLERAEKEDAFDKMGQLHQSLATWHYMQIASEITDSILYHDRKAYTYFEKAGNEEKMAKALAYIAESLSDQNDFKGAEEALFKSLSIFEKLGVKDETASTLSDLSSHFINLESYDDAIKYADRSEKLYSELEMPREYGIALFTIIPAHLKLGQNKIALQKANKAVELIGSAGKDMDRAAYAKALGNRADVYKAVGDFQRALEDSYEAWDVIKGIVDEEEQADGWKLGIAEILFLQQKYKEAIPYFEDYVAHLSERNNKGRLWEIQLQLAECYERTNQPLKAIQLYKTGWSEKDSIRLDKIANLQSELQIKYETEKKDETISDQASVISKQRLIQVLSFGVLVLLALLMAGIIWAYLKNQNKNKLLEKLNEELISKNKQNELLLKEIHHRVKNNLQIISSLLSLQSRSIQDETVKDAILDSESRVRSMSLIHKKLYKGEDVAAVEMKSYFETLSNNLIDAYADLDDEISVNLQMEEMDLDVKYAIPLGLIANELITNSLKYAFAESDQATIDIYLVKYDNELVLTISDNGNPDEANTPSGGSGFGSSLVRMLTQQLKGVISQQKDKGYVTEIRFPYSKTA